MTHLLVALACVVAAGCDDGDRYTSAFVVNELQDLREVVESRNNRTALKLDHILSLIELTPAPEYYVTTWCDQCGCAYFSTPYPTPTLCPGRIPMGGSERPLVPCPTSEPTPTPPCEPLSGALKSTPRSVVIRDLIATYDGEELECGDRHLCWTTDQPPKGANIVEAMRGGILDKLHGGLNYDCFEDSPTHMSMNPSCEANSTPK